MITITMTVAAKASATGTRTHTLSTRSATRQMAHICMTLITEATQTRVQAVVLLQAVTKIPVAARARPGRSRRSSLRWRRWLNCARCCSEGVSQSRRTHA